MGGLNAKSGRQDICSLCEHHFDVNTLLDNHLNEKSSVMRWLQRRLSLIGIVRAMCVPARYGVVMERRSVSQTAFFVSFALMLPLFPVGCKKSDETLDAVPVPPGARIFTVKRGALPLEEPGKLEAKDVTYVTPEHWGKLEWKIDDRTNVTPGEIIMRQETTDQEDRLQSRLQNMENQDSAILQKIREIDEAEQTQREEQKTVLASEDVAVLRLSELLHAPDRLTLDDALYSLRLSKARYDSIRDQVDETAPLAKKGYVSKLELAKLRVDSELARIQLEKSWRDAFATLAGSGNTDRKLSAMQWMAADLNTIIKDRYAEINRVRLRSQLGSMHGSRAWGQRALDDTRQWIKQAVVRAPVAGMVVHAKDWRNNDIELGRWVGPGFSVLNIIDRRKLKVRTEIPESAVNQIHVGETVCEIFTEQNGQGRRFTGSVLWIDQWGRDKNAVPGEKVDEKKGLSGVQVFNVEVNVDNVDPDVLNQGQIVWVHFPIDSRRDVTSIPKSLVRHEAGHVYVWVVDGDAGIARRKEITLGEKAGLRVIVQDGLSGGEKLIEPPLGKEGGS